MWALALWPKTICVLDLRPVGWPAWYERALELPTRRKFHPHEQADERWSAGALEGEGLGHGSDAAAETHDALLLQLKLFLSADS